MQESMRSVVSNRCGAWRAFFCPIVLFCTGVVMKSALIVEDHPVVRSMIKLVLKGEGFKRIYEASRGDQVLSLIREHQPDVVLLDLGLPGVAGLEVMDRIKAEDTRCRVVVFTSLEAQFYQDRCMRAGAVAYVSKSKDLDDLKGAVN